MSRVAVRRTYKCIDNPSANSYSVSVRLMRVEWDDDKSRQNLRKHRIRFETAVLVFDDPYAITVRDTGSEDEERTKSDGSRSAPLEQARFCLSSIRILSEAGKR